MQFSEKLQPWFARPKLNLFCKDGEGAGAGDGDDDGGGGDDSFWYNDDGVTALELGEKDMTQLQSFKSVPELAKGYANIFQMMGRDKIPMPETDEEWTNTFTRLGKPENADDYEVALHEDIPEDLKPALTEGMNMFRQLAHDCDLTKRQAEKFYQGYQNMIAESLKARAEQVDEEMQKASAQLKEKYGDAYAKKLALADQAVEFIGGQELVDYLEQTGLGREAMNVGAWIKVGEYLAEEMGVDKHGDNLSTNEDLQDEINELQAKPEYTDNSLPGHQAIVGKVQRLMQKLHPEKKT